MTILDKLKAELKLTDLLKLVDVSIKPVEVKLETEGVELIRKDLATQLEDHKLLILKDIAEGLKASSIPEIFQEQLLGLVDSSLEKVVLLVQPVTVQE
jgi:hypothetical protein